MEADLSKKVALVTGASSGIGEGAAIALAARGAKVAVTARREDRLQELVARISENGGEAIAIAGDITEEEFATSVVEQTVARYGRLDILVNSAGVTSLGGVGSVEAAKWRQVMDINFFASLYTCAAALPHMKKQGSGDIINISSTAGRRTGAAIGPYGASKFALNAMTEGLRQEVGAQGIRVCVLEPGATSTEISESIEDPQQREFMREHVRKEGAMKPDDIGATIVFIASLPPRANVSEILIRPTIDVAPK